MKFAFDIHVRPYGNPDIPDELNQLPADVRAYVVWVDVPDADSPSGFRRITSFPAHDKMFSDKSIAFVAINDAIDAIIKTMATSTEEIQALEALVTTAPAPE